MPRITLSIKDTEESVMRPVILEVVRDILKLTVPYVIDRYKKP